MDALQQADMVHRDQMAGILESRWLRARVEKVYWVVSIVLDSGRATYRHNVVIATSRQRIEGKGSEHVAT